MSLVKVRMLLLGVVAAGGVAVAVAIRMGGGSGVAGQKEVPAEAEGAFPRTDDPKAAKLADGKEPPKKPFAEGWKRVVPVPMPELGEGDRYVIWVEGGWLQVRRETPNGLTEWHVVLARATGPELPAVEAAKGTVRFSVSYRGGRYFVREDLNILSCLREPKRGVKGEWPAALAPDRFRRHGSAGGPGQPPMLQGWVGKDGFVVTSSVGQAEARYDCLVRLSPKDKESGYLYTTMAGSPMKRASWGQKSWLLDDGELLVAQRTLEATLELEVGDPAPPLSAKTLDGQPVTLEQYRGKYVLLDFWATWCKPCVAEIPHLEKVYEAFRGDGRLVIVGLSLDKEVDAPKKFVAARKIPWVQVFLGEASESPVAKAYRVGGIPAMVLVGPDGKVVAKDMRGEQIKEVVAKALSKK